MTFGLTPAGIAIERLPEIVAGLEASERDAFGAEVEVEPETVLGQINGTIGERIASVAELAEAVHNGGRLFTAAGSDLDDVAALVGKVRRPALATTFVGTLAGTPGTVVPLGSVVRYGDGARRFASVAPATIGGGGTVDVLFSCTTTGPVSVRATPAPTWNIETPVAGWTAVTNAADGNTGRDVETDARLRRRIVDSFTQGGNGLGTLRATLQAVAGVTEVRVFENVAGYPDGDGRPPHSSEAIVVGGTDAAIAAAIYATQPSGIQAFGLTVATVTDSAGDAHAVGFTRPTDLEIWIRVRVTPRANFPADGVTLIEDAILAIEPDLRSGVSFGSWLIADAIAEAIAETAIERVDITIGLAANPTSDATIAVGTRQRAALDSARLDVARTT